MANIGNIGGTHGNIPQRRIGSQEAQGKSAAPAGDAARDSAGSASQSGDSAEISASTQDLLAKAREAFDSTPAVREDRVAEVKQRIASGYYNNSEVIDALASGLTGVLNEEA